MRAAVFADIFPHEDEMEMTIARRYAELTPFDTVEVFQAPGIRVMAQKLQREIAQRVNDDYRNRDEPAYIHAEAMRNIHAASTPRRRATYKSKKMRARR